MKYHLFFVVGGTIPSFGLLVYIFPSFLSLHYHFDPLLSSLINFSSTNQTASLNSTALPTTLSTQDQKMQINAHKDSRFKERLNLVAARELH